MRIRNVTRALTAAWLFGVVVLGPAAVRAQDVSTMEKGHVTLVGCFVRMQDPTDTDDMRFMLADAKAGPATTVPDPNCTATGGSFLRLTHVDKHNLNAVPSGRWVEIYGELGKIRDADDLRKFEVDSFREVPVERRVAVYIPIPAPPVAAVETPAPEPEAKVETPQPEPVATSGTDYKIVKKLPHTASPLPLIALIGFFAFTGGLVLRLFERRRALERE
jgi:hypothetical protein